ncbi:metallophosphoesterase [Pontibacter sp. JAM-7]|uniref:metallophosphoesterase n=1 Tax=Pontibacter sp. JAM-7 TaxID=3366581 RepID=UPI003AF9B945
MQSSCSVAKAAPVELLQLTDLHLPEQPGTLRRGQDAEQRFQLALAAVADSDADLLLLTGDLTHHAPSAYRRLVDAVAKLPFPSCWIPGNHDLPDAMAAFPALNRKWLEFPHWRVILLDSTAAPNGLGGGSLAAAELLFLQQQLQDANDKHCLVVLHHNPMPVQSAWQDRISLGNPDAFWQCIEASQQVRAVVFGHLHHRRDERRGDVALYCSPATAPQYRAGTEEPEDEPDTYLAAPAFSRYRLWPDGSIDVSVTHLPTVE